MKRENNIIDIENNAKNTKAQISFTFSGHERRDAMKSSRKKKGEQK